MSLKIYDDSKNYTAVVVKLTNTFSLPGLDNVVGTSVFGNVCIIPKTYSLDETYIFFPSETELSSEYLKANNLYRNANLNKDLKSKGYFEENGRVKAIKFKGNKSTGVIMAIGSLANWLKGPSGHVNKIYDLKIGSEFNEYHEQFLCRKYIVPVKAGSNPGKKAKLLDEIIDSRMFPEHMDTAQLLKYLDRLTLTDKIVITTKVHGTSARVGHSLTKRKLKWHEKIAKKLGVKVLEEEYAYVVGSRHVIKSVGFTELKNKQHFYEDDLWTKIAHQYFNGKLNKGEMVYFEIIGREYPMKTNWTVPNDPSTIYPGAEIQKGYSYGLDRPKIYVYRITNINSQGIEIDLPWSHICDRCYELGIDVVPTRYQGSLVSYLHNWVKAKMEVPSKDWQQDLEVYLKENYLDKPSIIDPNVIEEGICLRVEKYPNPDIYKLKSPLFLIHESSQADKQIVDIETSN